MGTDRGEDSQAYSRIAHNYSQKCNEISCIRGEYDLIKDADDDRAHRVDEEAW